MVQGQDWLEEAVEPGPLQERIQLKAAARSRLQTPHSQPGLGLPGEPERYTFLIVFTMKANAPVACEDRRLYSAPSFTGGNETRKVMK